MTIDRDLERFRAVQRYAYKAVAHVEADLAPATSEREIATLLDDVQRGEGITEFLHEPFVWTGERTCCGHDGPTEAPVERDMPVILAIAPVVGGYPCDIAYSCIVGQNDAYDAVFFGLASIRTFLLERVRAGDTMKRIYEALDAMVTAQGWTVCHGSLGHMLWPDETVWTDQPGGDRPLPAGVWAIGPHVAYNGAGATWEEMLVVTDDDAFWLDEDLPHHRKWAGRTALPFAV
jgi:Xaa-Pro aminopeptidase